MSREELCTSIAAILALDAHDALVPHGLGGHVRTLLDGALVELQARTERVAEED